MTRDEFVKECVSRGYTGDGYKFGGRNQVLSWCKRNPKDHYTEEDLIAVYRYFNSMHLGDEFDAWILQGERRDADGC